VRYSLTKQTLSHFVATALGFFSGVPQPCIRAEMSILVDKEEQGITTCQFALFNTFFQIHCKLQVPEGSPSIVAAKRQPL